MRGRVLVGGRIAALLVGLSLVVAGCAAKDEPTAATPESDPSPSATTTTGHTDDEHSTEAARPRPLRAGEKRLTVAMPEAYLPSAPTGVGTDDYRCFLLDPGLDEPAYLTGTDVRPGTPSVVHHVILFQVPPDQVEAAEAKDDSDIGQGWTCFGGTGLGANQGLDDPWLGAWAPGGRESILRPGYGVPITPGSRIVMQVHYNLLAGPEPDVSAARLRIAPGDEDLKPVDTMLLPAPVELPCRPGHTDNPLCDRDAALVDVKKRFGEGPGSTADLLHLLCGTPVEPGNEQSCVRKIPTDVTVLGVAGHMHLLGKAITITANPGTDRERTLLDIPVWDFDNQGAKPIRPEHLKAGDEVEVTCRHSQSLRDVLPSFEGQPDRYVMWGEGTTDEMCLGILQVTDS